MHPENVYLASVLFEDCIFDLCIFKTSIDKRGVIEFNVSYIAIDKHRFIETATDEIAVTYFRIHE